MKKSMLAFLLALVMVLSLFAGCGKQEETPAQETEQSPAAETEQSPAAETEQAPETPAEVSFPSARPTRWTHLPSPTPAMSWIRP